MSAFPETNCSHLAQLLTSMSAMIKVVVHAYRKQALNSPAVQRLLYRYHVYHYHVYRYCVYHYHGNGYHGYHDIITMYIITMDTITVDAITMDTVTMKTRTNQIGDYDTYDIAVGFMMYRNYSNST